MEEQASTSTRRRVALLGAQAFALGLVVAWVTIPANAIFLESYGSGPLPWTYVAAALVGIVASAGLTAAFRRKTLVSVTMRVLVAFAVALAGSFLALRASGAWVSAVLLALLPITIPVGFIFVVGQAGMLLDVRVLKALYGRVVAGFAMGFLTGGVVAPLMLRVFGRTDSLVGLAAVVAGAFALIVWCTQRAFPELSAVVDTEHDEAPHPTLGSLARNPYVVLLALFQVLSAIESQWLDYLVYDRAARRYESTDALADFISRFTAITYGTDIVFLLCIAGLMLRRFGLRVGLTLDGIVVLAFVGATIAFGVTLGSTSTLVFVLIVAARVSDLTLADGAVRTSLGAAYQAVPVRQRLAAQAVIEGLAVPVAIGFSGIVLIVVRQAVGTEGLLLPVMTSAVVIVWILVAVLVFRGYRVNLLANLRRRSLDPAELFVDDANTLSAIDRLIDSDDEREIRLGVQTLMVADHPQLPARLERLTADERDGVRSYALDRLLDIDPPAAARAAREGIDHPSAAIRAASVRALGVSAGPSDAAMLFVLWRDPHHDVRIAAAAALGGLGDADVVRRLSDDVRDLADSDDPGLRALAARVLACCGPGTGIDRGALGSLLGDPDDDVVEEALRAVHVPEEADLLGHALAHLDSRRLAATAVETLARGGSTALDLVDEGLSDRRRYTRSAQRQLARVCRIMGGDEAIRVLCRHLAHHDREVGVAVARALASLSESPMSERTKADRDESTTALLDERTADDIRRDLHDATHALRALCMFVDAPEYAMLARALRDHLDLLRERMFALLSVRYGAADMAKVAFQLAQTDARSHALAVEWMEVTFAAVDRPALAMIEPGLSINERHRRLAREFALPPADPPAILRDLVEDPDGLWRRPWISACALAGILANGDVHPDAFVLQTAIPDGEASWSESAVLFETFAGMRDRLGV